LEYSKNNQVATNHAIVLTNAAIRINSSGEKECSPAFCVVSYNNLANFYRSLNMYDKALLYFDSALFFRYKYFVPKFPVTAFLREKAKMLYNIGDYQHSIEVFGQAILKAYEEKKNSSLNDLFNQRAQSYLMTGQLQEAMKDVTSSIYNSKKINDENELINSMLIKADILAKQESLQDKQKDFSEVLKLYNQAIKARMKTRDYGFIANDYVDLGNIYNDKLKQYAKAKDCYKKSLSYAEKTEDPEKIATARINLEVTSFNLQDYALAEKLCIQVMNDLKLSVSNTILQNPTSIQLSTIGNKELVLVILENKTELLLKLFTQTNNRAYLSACLQTALLTDTLITNIRHQQLDEQSKLYWRDWTRIFFTRAMEACYLANDTRLAFFFMEKSRAVLLNDKLNELGASAHLPEEEAKKEQELQIDVLNQQQKLSLFDENENEYKTEQLRYLDAKEKLENYIRTLEKKYPSYYHYRYADDVVSESVLQRYLQKNNESFVHYFMNDTVTYILSITPQNTKLVKFSKDSSNIDLLKNFLWLCSDKQNLNNNYQWFISLSYSLYHHLFQPLNIQKGRIIICPDNFLIPFEALCTSVKGNNFLISNYSFSYVYSARYLLKKYETQKGKGDFIGFAPVSFNSSLDVPDLKNSAKALKQSAKYYHNTSLFINNQSSRYNFLNSIAHYSVVNVLSHANADPLRREPSLFMQDSIISLSELQLIRSSPTQPVTQLVILSACETNAGKNAKGEGIFSFARGFASAGIPSVAATLWKADEKTIYDISQKFHEYLSKGMPKDEALQKAKLSFIQNADSEKQLPYYWANLILTGNNEPLLLAGKQSSLPFILIAISIIAVMAIIFARRKRIVE